MSTAAGAKRKATDIDRESSHSSDSDGIEIPSDTKLDSCNVVRGKINRFIESGEMKIGEFCDTLGVSGNGYRRFMAMNGKDKGSQSDTYIAAWKFFKRREIAGIKTPKKQKIASSSAQPDESIDVSGISLEGMLHALQHAIGSPSIVTRI